MMTTGNKRNILIMSMLGGFGHIKAGEALLEYAKENLPNINVEHVDISDIDPSLKKYSVRAYDFFIKKVPILWKIIYTYAPVFIVKKALNLKGVFNKKIIEYIVSKNPDVIIFTNVIILPLFLWRIKKLLPNIKMGIMVTDYHGHAYYRFSEIDYYFVASLQVAEDLKNSGIKKEKIIITGIPISSKFYLPKSNKDLRLKYHINNDFYTVLIIASFKISGKNVVALVMRLLELKPKINIVFIANGNDYFYGLINDNFAGQERVVNVLWTNAMEEYMGISDVIITKAGGLTVSECLALKKQMIIINPIPGQEEYNARFVESNGFGRHVNTVSEIIEVLPEIMAFAKNNENKISVKINPAKKIFQYL